MFDLKSFEIVKFEIRAQLMELNAVALHRG